ncbi:MAG: hypothetical protein WCG55_04680 [bacterium]
MTWAMRRRIFILFIIFIVFGGLTFWHYSAQIFVTPSCTDGVRNGDETGIDCGGTMCTTMCATEVRTPTILWFRSFPVTDTVYNAAALIENKNNGATRSLPYEFRLYDKDNILLARRDGVAVVPPLGRYVIVETGISVGATKVGATEFSFSNTPSVWERIPETVSKLRIGSSSISLDTSGIVPRLSATLTNFSPTIALTNTVVAAVLYDDQNNTVNVSKTVVPEFAPNSNTSVTFTWPQAFPRPVARYDIVPIIDVFHTH